jgi:Protein of unknown function (DUF642)/PEP-CTERM motif
MKNTCRNAIKLASFLTILGCAMLANTQQAQAQNLIANPSFENPVVATGGFNFVPGGSSIGAWQVVGPNVLLIESTYGEPSFGVNAYTAQNGLNALDLTGNTNVSTTGVTQTINTIVGQPYDISFYVGRATGSLFLAPPTVDLSIDGGPRTSYTNSGSTAGTINWQQFLTNFTATNPTTAITFYNHAGSVAVNYTGLDNVSVTAAPEPGTLALIAVGGMGIVSRLRLRRKLSSDD